MNTRTRLTILGALLVLTVSGVYAEGAQVLYPSVNRQTLKGPEAWFTGDVRVEPLFPANETARYSGAYVTFQPGARTRWHLHSAGQHMIVTSGVGLTGTRDGTIVRMVVGDAVWCPPDIDHWHGATQDSAMTHLVLTGVVEGGGGIWKEAVTDAEYQGGVKEE